MWPEPRIEPPPAPHWMPPKLVEARRFAHFGSLGFLIAAAVHGLLLLTWLLPNLAWVTPAAFLNPGSLLNLLAILGSIVGSGAVRMRVLGAIDANWIARARNGALLWTCLAVVLVVFGVTLALIPAILLVIAWVQLEPQPRPDWPREQPPQSPEGAYPTPPPEQWPSQ